MTLIRNVVLACCALALPALAQGTPAAAPAPAPGPTFQSDAALSVAKVQKEMVSLEQAIPQSKFTWRPGKGVRSVSEVYVHAAGAGYWFHGAHDPAPAGLQICHHRSDVLVGDDHAHGLDRLEKRDRLWGGRVLQRQGAGRLKGHVAGVHRVCLPARQGDAEVDHRVAGPPATQPFSSWARIPFSTLGMYWRGTAPPTTLSTNSKPDPRSRGSTVMSHTAY